MAKTIDQIMEQIALLLARADHPNTPVAEATLARERAEKMMRQHRIDESSLSDEEKALRGIRPVDMEWIVAPSSSEFMNTYYSLCYYIVSHVDGMFQYKWRNVDGEHMLVAHVFGFESDLRFGDMLFQSAKAAFREALEPQVNEFLSDQENIYRMRSAGMERNRIANALWGSAFDDGNAHGRVSKLFKAACAEHGTDAAALTGKGTNMKTYRRSFAEGFVSRLSARLSDAKYRAGLDNTGGLVLANRREQVQEAFYTAYPSMRPQSRSASQEAQRRKASRTRAYKEQPTNWAARAAGAEAGNRVDITGAGPTGSRIEKNKPSIEG